MEKRIKALYIITILAILGFLGMQVYWLYTRYEYSLTQYEDAAQRDILAALKAYRQERIAIMDSTGGTFLNPTTYSVTKFPNQKSKDFKVTRKRISAPGYAQRVLGIKENRPLTEDEIIRAAMIISSNDSLQTVLMEEATLHNPPSESSVMDALKNYDLELNVPFSVSKVDSLLKINGYHTEVSSIKTDSIEWSAKFLRHKSVFSPTMEIISPYSEMDKKSVRIIAHIPSSQVIAGMADTLIFVAIISLLLIACLIYQFLTIVRLDKLDKMRTQFTSSMIHELKRPVSTLKMCVSGLSNERMTENPEMRSKLMGQTRKALDLLSAYFSKMRDLTFNKSQEIPLNCENVSVHSLFDECEARVSKPKDKIVEVFNLIPEEFEAFADKTHMMNIFTNLIENAVKYSGDKVEITAKAENFDSGTVLISVADNGNGIEASDINKIFTQFYRGHAADTRIPGLGLGLAYVKMLVEAHGGKVSVVSHTDGSGKGSCFTIELPQ